MMIGHDISTLPQVEALGPAFRTEAGIRPLEQILADHGATHSGSPS